MPTRPFLTLLTLLICAGGASAAEHVSKLEARHFRQACERQASEGGVPKQDVAAFVQKCIDRRIVRRPQARACRIEWEARTPKDSNYRDFMRNCIRAKAPPAPR